MKRLTLLLTAIGVALLQTSGVALAAPKLNPHDPANHGTNSYQPFYNEAFPGYNFGRCQSQTAKQPGPAKIAQVKNPAILTKGDPTMRVGSACPKG